ncbi:hypothetical protein [Dyadobacter sandarakinus]|uniref:Uncharacterized protein n=1 Tax=Dyadobacter sandarakinus TaxID=2747268 RepID=A0ABX7I128_9BACT|nr:hypothetical protein [Dyadobacter sandarakinus]QRQ99454.1 hypothetical protein HWI92_00275 [Dyadobacter sandarakinus]
MAYPLQLNGSARRLERSSSVSGSWTSFTQQQQSVLYFSQSKESAPVSFAARFAEKQEKDQKVQSESFYSMLYRIDYSHTLTRKPSSLFIF